MKRMSQWMLWGVGAALLLGSPMAIAQSAPSAVVAVPSKVNVEIELIRATNEHERIDQRLSSQLKHLKRLPFKGFELLEAREMTLAPGTASAITAKGKELRITLISHDERAAKLKVQVRKGEKQILDTMVTINRNRSFFVQVGSLDSGVLVMPLSVRY